MGSCQNVDLSAHFCAKSINTDHSPGSARWTSRTRGPGQDVHPGLLSHVFRRDSPAAPQGCSRAPALGKGQEAVPRPAWASSDRTTFTGAARSRGLARLGPCPPHILGRRWGGFIQKRWVRGSCHHLQTREEGAAYRGRPARNRPQRRRRGGGRRFCPHVRNLPRPAWLPSETRVLIAGGLQARVGSES